jgi:hypothetical protein
MPNVKGTTNKQTLFLRAFRTHPAGPAPADWPSPAILRKWLRKPAFVKALHSLQEALRFQTDFHLSNAATNAARKFAAQDSELTTQDLNRLLRHAHLRQRFAAIPSVPANENGHGEDDDEQIKVPPKPPEPRYIVFGTNNRPIWIGDRALLHKLAFHEGYTAPLSDWPDFPKPVPQDTFYYQLLQSRQVLLWYMNLYDQSGNNDHRYQPILVHCKHLIPSETPPKHMLPHFQTQPAPPEPNPNS